MPDPTPASLAAAEEVCRAHTRIAEVCGLVLKSAPPRCTCDRDAEVQRVARMRDEAQVEAREKTLLEVVSVLRGEESNWLPISQYNEGFVSALTNAADHFAELIGGRDGE